MNPSNPFARIGVCRFTVTRQRRFCWEVRAILKYSSRLIGQFWTERAAQRVCDKLNQLDRDWQELVALEDDYDTNPVYFATSVSGGMGRVVGDLRFK